MQKVWKRSFLRPKKCANAIPKRSHPIGQPGPTTLHLRANLQNCDNSRATSNKMMYKTTDSRHSKLKNGG